MVLRVLASFDDGGTRADLCERSVQHREKGGLDSPVLVVGESRDLTTDVTIPSSARSVLRPVQQRGVDGDPDGGRPADEANSFAVFTCGPFDA